jgi:hypothetical protein
MDLALTSLISGGRSVRIVSLWDKSPGFVIIIIVIITVIIIRLLLWSSAKIPGCKILCYENSAWCKLTGVQC